MNYNQAKTDKLLSRQDWKERVFAKNKGKCLFCSEAAVDAHHIFDRKLWVDGGYYINNGAPLCAQHHWDAEKSNITVEQIWHALALSPHMRAYVPGMNKSKNYDKWGKEISC